MQTGSIATPACNFFIALDSSFAPYLLSILYSIGIAYIYIMKTIINMIGNETKIFADTFDYEAFDQVKALANFEPYLNERIRVMPDAHVGKGSTVGTTMTISDKVTPNLVGVDIGCGMLTTKLKEKEVDIRFRHKGRGRGFV